MYEYTGTKNHQVAYIVQYVYEAKVLSLQSQCQSQKFEIFYSKISENFSMSIRGPDGLVKRRKVKVWVIITRLCPFNVFFFFFRAEGPQHTILCGGLICHVHEARIHERRLRIHPLQVIFFTFFKLPKISYCKSCKTKYSTVVHSQT